MTAAERLAEAVTLGERSDDPTVRLLGALLVQIIELRDDLKRREASRRLKEGEAQPPSAGNPAVRSASGDVFKFGRSKGTPLASGSVSDLRWYGEVIAKSIDDPSKSRYRANNQRDLDLINGLLAAHHEAPIGGGGQGFVAPSGVPDFGTGGGDDDVPFASCEGMR